MQEGEFSFFYLTILTCLLNTNFDIWQGSGGIQSPDVFTLTLRVRIPQTTSYLMHYWNSPTIIIDQYTKKYCGELLSPGWFKTVQTELHFWQNRILMLEMMLYFVRNIPHNCSVSRHVTSWCYAMSVSYILYQVE